MTSRTNEQAKLFHSMEQLKVELFPNMPLVEDDITPDLDEVDEVDSLAKKLIEEMMRHVKKDD